eukprot:3214660-Rhodomonas_salina.2
MQPKLLADAMKSLCKDSWCHVTVARWLGHVVPSESFRDTLLGSAEASMLMSMTDGSQFSNVCDED